MKVLNNMDKDICTIMTAIGVMTLIFLGGLVCGLLIGLDRQAQLDNERLRKLGIEIVETRVFDGEPEYSYKIVDRKKDEANRR